MRKSDIYRKSVINQILTEGKTINNRIRFTYNNNTNTGLYREIITLDEIKKSTNDFEVEGSLELFLENIILHLSK